MLFTLFTVQKTTNVAPKAQTAYKVAPISWTQNCLCRREFVASHALAREIARAPTPPSRSRRFHGENDYADSSQPSAVAVRNRAARVITFNTRSLNRRRRKPAPASVPITTEEVGETNALCHLESPVCEFPPLAFAGADPARTPRAAPTTPQA
jgi:hypothetical protein